MRTRVTERQLGRRVADRGLAIDLHHRPWLGTEKLAGVSDEPGKHVRCGRHEPELTTDNGVPLGLAESLMQTIDQGLTLRLASGPIAQPELPEIERIL